MNFEKGGVCELTHGLFVIERVQHMVNFLTPFFIRGDFHGDQANVDALGLCVFQLRSTHAQSPMMGRNYIPWYTIVGLLASFISHQFPSYFPFLYHEGAIRLPFARLQPK